MVGRNKHENVGRNMLKKAGKIIIHFDDTIEPWKAVQRVGQVVSEGKVSKTKHGLQYCFHTSFINGDHVSCRPKRKGINLDTDTFDCYNKPLESLKETKSTESVD